MSSLWDVPQYLIMAFSLAFDTPVEKASRVSYSPPPAHTSAKTPTLSGAAMPDETTWLRAMKIAAPHSEIVQAYASRIFVTSTGRYYVPDATERGEILSLRSNADVTARVLAAATQTLVEELTKRAGHRPTRGALVLAHLLGESAALRYMQRLEAAPDTEATVFMPALSAALVGDTGITLAQLDTRLARATRSRRMPQFAHLRGTMTKPDEKHESQMASR